MKALKKTMALLVSLALVCSLAVALVACGASPESIEITKAPTKTEYVEGQKFDPAGMEVTLVYSNEEKEVVTGYTYEPAGELKTTDTQITIKYKAEGSDEEITATQPITVAAKVAVSLKITAQPAKKDYKEGENFDKSGMKVTAAYNDGTEAEVADYTVKPARPLCVNDKNVYVSVGDASVAVPVTVAEDETLPDPMVSYKVRGTTNVGGQEANVNFTFYSDYTVTGLVESGMGSMVDNMLGKYLSLPGVWEKNGDDFTVTMIDFTFDPSTLEGLAGLVESFAPDMSDMFNQLVAMDPIEIEGSTAQVDFNKADGTLSYECTISAMGIQAPFTCTGRGAPEEKAVKAGEHAEAEWGDFSKMESSMSTLLGSNEKQSNGYYLQYTCVDGNVWKMTVDSEKEVKGATIGFNIKAYKANCDISDYLTLKVNGKAVELKGALEKDWYTYTAAADLIAGENTIELTWKIPEAGKITTFSFDYVTFSSDVTILNPSFGEK